MEGQIALAGGEEFRSRCEEMDLEIMRASGQDPAQVLIIPTAAVTGPAKAANDGVTHFGRLGADARQLMVLDKSHADDADFVAPSRSAGVIYFTGGSPTHLLASIQDSQLLAFMLEALENGAVLAGSSAGAMVMGSVMRQPEAGGWTEGLGIVPGVVVLPHHEKSDPSETCQRMQTQLPSGLTVLGIDARTACLGRPGNWKVVGSGSVTLYRGPEWQVFGPGESLTY